MTNQIELLKTKLERMDIDDVRDVAGDDSYSNEARRIAQEIVDRYDYPEAL